MTNETTKTETPETEPETKLERKTCGRCGGCGRYSWCQRFGSVCFGCGGSGTVFTKRGHAANEYLKGLLSCRADSLVVGDIIRVDSITAGCEPCTYWARVTEVTVRDGGGVTVRSCNEKLGIWGTLSQDISADTLVRKSCTREVKRAAIEKALAFQATLTASGKPVRLKKDGTPYAARKSKPKAPKAAPVAAPVPEAPAAPQKPGRVITAQYPGVCRDCGATFPAGTKILWSRDHGTTCIECPPAEQPAAPEATPVEQPVEQDPEAIEAAREREADEREYQAGVADAEQYRADRELFGQDVADGLDIQRDLLRGD